MVKNTIVNSKYKILIPNLSYLCKRMNLDVLLNSYQNDSTVQLQ